jgi:formylglycine-generating enzyme required for sulfatase activity
MNSCVIETKRIFKIRPLRGRLKPWKYFFNAYAIFSLILPLVTAVFLLPGCNFTPDQETVPSTPASPSVVRGDRHLKLSWPPAEGAAGYELWVGTTDDTGGAVKYGNDITGTAADITGLTNGTIYYVRLKAKNSEGRSGFSPSAGERPEASKTPPEGFVYVPGGTINGSDSFAITVIIPPGYSGAGSGGAGKGVFVQGRRVPVNSLFWSKHETTYKLWYEVRVWAEANGYYFQNRGIEGRTGQGTPSSPSAGSPPGVNQEHPVSAISWRDALVWCNAYSEKNNKEPVYTYGGAVLRDSQNANAAACDGAVMDKAKNGYRLPTEAEREFAARGGDPDAADWMYTYAGSNNIDEIGWHHGNSPYQTHPVGAKRANRLGIHDLSGNVQEWCWDWMNYAVDISPDTPPDGAARDALAGGRNAGNQKPFNGGGVGSNSVYASVVFRWGFSSNYTDLAAGFRVVCKAE